MPLPEGLPQKIKLTQLETDLLTMISTLIEHVRSRDGNGNESKLFCLGCEKNRTHPCVLPVIEPYLEELESRRVEGVLEMPSDETIRPGQIMTLRPHQWKWKTPVMMRAKGKIAGVNWSVHEEEKIPDDTLLKAVAHLVRDAQIDCDLQGSLSEVLDRLKAINVGIYPGKPKPIEGSANG